MADGEQGWKAEFNFGGTNVAYAQDVEPTFDAEEIDVTTKNSDGWAEFLQGKKRWAVDLGVLWVPTNAVIRAIRDAWISGDEVAVKIRDTAGYGYNGTVIVTSIGAPQPLDDAMTMPVTLRGTGTVSVVDGAS